MEKLICNALNGHIRVNTTLKTIEVYDDFGVKLVLKNLDTKTYNAFKKKYPNY